MTRFQAPYSVFWPNYISYTESTRENFHFFPRTTPQEYVEKKFKFNRSAHTFGIWKTLVLHANGCFILHTVHWQSKKRFLIRFRRRKIKPRCFFSKLCRFRKYFIVSFDRWTHLQDFCHLRQLLRGAGKTYFFRMQIILWVFFI